MHIWYNFWWGNYFKDFFIFQALGLNRSIIAKFDFKTERQYFFQLSHHVPFNGSETELAEEIKVSINEFLIVHIFFLFLSNDDFINDKHMSEILWGQILNCVWKWFFLKVINLNFVHKVMSFLPCRYIEQTSYAPVMTFKPGCKNFIHRYIECLFCLPVSFETVYKLSFYPPCYRKIW